MELLSNYGSSAAEPLLWQLYEKWCKHWAGREHEVNLRAFDQTRPDNLIFGRSLLRSIAEGNHWLTDEPKLQRLMAMSKVATIRWEIELYLEKWNRKPLSVSIFSCGPTDQTRPVDVGASNQFSGHIAHDDFNSLEALKEKLAQFPRGTQFELWRLHDEEERSCVDELHTFMGQHEFLVSESKKD